MTLVRQASGDDSAPLGQRADAGARTGLARTAAGGDARAARRAAALRRIAAEMEPHLQPAWRNHRRCPGRGAPARLPGRTARPSAAWLPDGSVHAGRCRHRRGTARPRARDHAAAAADRPGRADRQEGGVPAAGGRRMPLAARSRSWKPGSRTLPRRELVPPASDPDPARHGAADRARTSSAAPSPRWIGSPRSAGRTCRMARSCFAMKAAKVAGRAADS